MTIKRPTYVDAIGEGFLDVRVTAASDGSVYSDLSIEAGSAPLPSKDELDSWIDSKLRELVWSAIKEKRDNRKEGGVKVGTKWFHSDGPSRVQQLGLVLFGQNLPPNIMWKTMDGTFVLMTPALAQQILLTTAASDATLFEIAESHKAYMLASPNPANYDFSHGWPPTFGE